MTIAPDRRAFLLASAGVLFAPVLTCCERSQGSTIRFVVRTGLESVGLRAIAERFGKDRSVTVTVNELGRDSYLSAVPTQLLTGASDADVAFLPSTLIAELAAAKAIAPLDKGMNVHDPDLITTSTYQGQTYALPSDISSMFLFYRTDLIGSPPQTWDEYLEVAKRFSKATNPDSPTQFGAALPGQSGEELPKGFYNILWSFGGSIIENGKVGLDSAESLAAARYFRSLVDAKVLAPDITSWGFSQMFDNLLSGALAMAGPFWNAAAPLIASSQSAYKDKIAYTLVPGVRKPDGSILRTPFQQAWTLALNAKAQNADGGMKFVDYATGKAGGRIYATKGGNPARYSILDDAAFAKDRPDFAMLSKSLRVSRSEPNVPYYASMHDVMNGALTKILVGASSPEDAMRNAAARIRVLEAKASK